MRRRVEMAIVGAGFVAGRALWARAGIPFRSDPIDFFAQLLDPPLLQERLLESLWHLHAQPPLLNLLSGLALEMSPEDPGRPLAVLFLLAGGVTCLSLFSVLRDLRLGAWLAGGLALAATATPTVLVYEHWFFYPHLAAALITATGALLLRSRDEPGPWLAAAFATLAALVWLRSLFHPAFFLGAVGIAAALAPRGARRRVLVVSAVPTALVLGLAVKNLVLFGFFGTSSWGGNSAHRMMTETLPPATVEAMVEAGELSPISREWEFSRPEVYLEILRPERGDTGVPALDETGKTRARENAVNYNHWVYPLASKEYLRGGLAMLRAHPGAYVQSVLWTTARFLDPVTDDHFVRPMRYRVRKVIGPFEAAQRSPWLRGLVVLCVLVVTARLLAGRTSPRERLFTAFLAGTILWVAATGILLEYGENNRFRYQIGPLLLVAVAIVARDATGAVRARLGSGGTRPALNEKEAPESEERERGDE